MLASLSSREVSEWMAYFRLLAEESEKPPGRTEQRASGDQAYEILAKAAQRGGR